MDECLKAFKDCKSEKEPVKIRSLQRVFHVALYTIKSQGFLDRTAVRFLPVLSIGLHALSVRSANFLYSSLPYCFMLNKPQQFCR